MSVLRQEHKTFNLTAKLIISFILVSLGVTGVTIGPALYLFSGMIQTNNEERALQAVDGLNTVLEDYKRNALSHGAIIARNPLVINALENRNAEQIVAVLAPLVKEAKMDFVTVTDNKGIAIARTHTDKKGDSVINQANVQNALAGTAFAAIEPGTEIKLAARAGIPVKNAKGELIGVLSIGYNAAKNEVVDHAKALFSSDTTLFLEDVRVSTTILKDGQRVTGTKLDGTIAQKVLKEGQRYTGTAEILGTAYITTYAPLIGPNNKPIGVIFAGQKLSAAIAARDKLIYTVAGITLLVLVITILLAIVIARKISRPIKELAKTAELVASGDLTLTVPVTSKDEVGALAQGFNHMITELKALITKVNGLAQTVAASAQELNASADQSAQAANQVAISITDVAHGTERQRSAVDDASGIVQEITATIRGVASNAYSVAATSEQTAVAAKEGYKAVESAISQISIIEALVKQSAAKVGRLGERSNEIGRIVDTISSISSQTNLLALNAAIEAARAGEAGRGFSVVAEEVRKLAEGSQEAAKQISDLVGEIQGETQEAVLSMKEGSQQVAVGSQVVNHAGEAFQNIVSLIDKVAKQIQDISSAIQKIATGSEQIVSSMQVIDDTTKHAVGEMQSVSAATEEQSASMQEIASASQALAQLAQQMQDAVTQFRV